MKRSGLIAIILLAFGLRLFGLSFGLPDHHHAYSYNPDEWTPLRAFRAMNPRQFDFNPHYFFNPTFHYYLVGAGIAAARLGGILRTDGNERFYFEHPEHLARMILAGRLLSVLLGTLTVWLTYLLARRLGLGRGTSQMAALFLALHTSHVIHSHFMTVNAAVTFWVVAAMLGIERWIRKGGFRSLLLTGVAAGLAASTKYSGLLLWPLIGLAAVFRFQVLRRPAGSVPGSPAEVAGRVARETVAIWAMAAAAFLAGTPYLVLAFREAWAGFQDTASYLQSAENHVGPTARPLWRVIAIHMFASTPGLVLASLAGVVLAVRRSPALGVILGLWNLAFFLVSLRAGALSSDSRFLPMFPLVALFAALALARLLAWRRGLGLAGLALCLALLALGTTTCLSRFVGPVPQEEASAWARARITGAPRVAVAGSPIYYAPDLPARELLHSENVANYDRETSWDLVRSRSLAEVLALRPDVIFLTLYLPFRPAGSELLADPAYEVVARFPGKVHFLGRRVHVPLDLYDVDAWILKRRDSGLRFEGE